MVVACFCEEAGFSDACFCGSEGFSDVCKYLKTVVWTVRGCIVTPFSASVDFLLDILLFPDNMCSDCDCDSNVTTVLSSAKGANYYLNPYDNT